MDKKKKTKLKATITAIVLVFVTVIVTATAVFADNRYLYISDIRMATASTYEEAAKQLEDAGYTPLKQNLSQFTGKEKAYREYYKYLCSRELDMDYPNYNEDGYNRHEGSDYYTIIGYKTTDNINDAITDVKFMNMNGGYEVTDYNAISASLNVYISQNATQLMESVNEMKKNLEKGSFMAQAGKEILDMYYYLENDGTHTPLSDYLFDDARTIEDFKSLTLICNTVVINSIYNALVYGCVDVGDSFAERFTDQTIEEPESWSKQDNLYSDQAEVLSERIKDFADMFEKGKENVTKTVTTVDGEVLAEDVSVDTTVNTDENVEVQLNYTGEISDEVKSAAKDIDKKDDYSAVYEIAAEQDTESVQEQESNYYIYVAVYQALTDVELPNGIQNSNYGNPTNLGDYIIDYANAIKDKSKLTIDDYRYLYPLVSSLTTAQQNVVRMEGIISFATWLTDASEAENVKKDLHEKIKSEVTDLFKDLEADDVIDENNKIELFLGQKEELYKEKIGLTEKGVRAEATEAEYTNLTDVHTPKNIQNLQKAIQILNIVSAAAGVVSGVATIVVSCILGSMSSMGTFIAVMTGGTALAGGALAGAFIFSLLGAITSVVAVLATVALLICSILMVIFSAQAEAKYWKAASYKYMPRTMFDYREDIIDYETNEIISPASFVEYTAVLTADGSKVADVNGYKSVDSMSQWEVLYYSKDQSVSSPIIIDKGDDQSLFAFSSTDCAAPEGYRSLANFGQKNATDVRCFHSHRNVFKKYHNLTLDPLYISFRTENSIKGKTDGPQYDQGQYFASMEISTQATPEAAKDELLKKNYQVYDINLAPNSEYYSYLGYTTTSNEKSAIKDIRVAAEAGSKSSRNFGSVSYGCLGVTANNIGFYATSSSTAGFPILVDSLKFVNDKTLFENGYEPVNQFSGGDYYDLTIARDGKKLKDSESLYIGFKYDGVEFKDNFLGTTKEYIDGFAFFYVKNGEDSRAAIESQGYKVLSLDESEDLIVSNYELSQLHNKGKGYSNNYDITLGTYHDYSTFKEYSTYIAVSTTFNPYRAISDVHTYEAAPTDESDFEDSAVSQLFSAMSLGGNAYASCETFNFIDDKIAVRKEHAYTSYTYNFGDIREFDDSVVHEVDGEKIVNDNMVPLSGLYVLGPTSTTNAKTGKAEPNALSVDDLYISKTERTSKNGFKPVTSFVDLYNEKADNLTFEYKTQYTHHLYIHVKGEAPKKGKYIKSIYVGSYIKSQDKNASDYSANFADETAIVSAFANTGVCKLIRSNIAAESNDTQLYFKPDGENGGTYTFGQKSNSAAYIAVTYTDNPNEAIRGLEIQNFSSYTDANSKITYKKDGATFKKCGDNISRMDGLFALSSEIANTVYGGGIFAIYATTNYAYGDPITDVFADSSPYKDNHIPILTQNNNNATYNCPFILSYNRADLGEVKTYVNKVWFSWRSKDDLVKYDQLKAGITHNFNYDKNKGLGGNYLNVGYSTTTDSTDPNIITDLKVVINPKSATSEMEINGITYHLLQNYDLNKGVKGDYVYLYYTTDKSLNPISKIFLYKFKDKTFADENYFYETGNLASGTKNTYVLGLVPTDCYKYSKDNTAYDHLTFKYIGNLPDYNNFAKGLYNFNPEWSNYASKVKTLEVNGSVTNLTKIATSYLTNATKFMFNHSESQKIDIEDGAIPKNATIYGEVNSSAYEYYKTYGERDNLTFFFTGLSTVCHKGKDDETTFTIKNGTLYIEGSGVLGDEYGSGKLSDLNNTPWGKMVIDSQHLADGQDPTTKVTKQQIASIESVVIKGDFTEIYDGYFSTLSSVKDATIYSDNVKFDNAFVDASKISFTVRLNSGVYNDCVNAGYNVEKYIIDKSNKSTTSKEKWNLSGDTLVITKSGSYSNYEMDDTHLLVDYGIDKTAIKHVLIMNNVAALPEHAFDSFTNLIDVKVVSDVIKQKADAKNEKGKAITYSLKKLPNYCFKNCQSLTTFSNCAAMTTIGDCAFYGCKVFKEFTFPKTGTSIGKEAFVGCADGFNLTIVNNSCKLPDSRIVDSNGTITASINSAAYINALTYDVNFVDSSNSNYPWTMDKNGKLTISQTGAIKTITWSMVSSFAKEIEIAEGVTSLPASAFKDFTKLEKITLASTLKTIPTSMCEGCTALKTVVFSKSVEEIGNAAFKGCTSLDLIGEECRKKDAVAFAFPEGLITIGDYAFDSLYNPEETKAGISLPSTLTSIGTNAINWKNGFVTVCFKDASISENGIAADEIHLINYSNDLYDKLIQYESNIVKMANYNFSNGTLTFSSSMSDKTERYAREELAPWYDENDRVKTLVIDKATLDTSIFRGSTSLEKVQFNSEGAFYNLYPTIPDYAFEGCSNLKTVEYVGNKFAQNTVIGKYAFKDCNALSNFTGLEYYCSIGDYAFSGCVNAFGDDFNIPENIRTVGEHAFDGINVNENIVRYNFDEDTGLLEVTMCNSKSECDFAGSEEIKKVTFDDSITSIPAGMFKSCKNLTEVTLPENLKLIPESIFESCTNLKTVNIPTSVTIIGERAFYRCTSLGLFAPDSTFVLHEGLVEIGADAFRISMSEVEDSIVLPSTLKHIGYKAFTGIKPANFVVLSAEANIPNAYLKCQNIYYNYRLAYSESGNIEQYAEDYSINAIRICDYNIDGNSLVLTADEDYGSAMFDFTFAEQTPWFSKKDGITKIVIGSGIENIGAYAFSGLDKVEEIEIEGESLKSIGEYAFDNMTALSTISLPSNVESIEEKACGEDKNAKTFTVTSTTGTTYSTLQDNGFDVKVDASRLSSAFTENPSYIVVALFGGTLVIIAAVLILNKRRKLNKKAEV